MKGAEVVSAMPLKLRDWVGWKAVASILLLFRAAAAVAAQGSEAASDAATGRAQLSSHSLFTLIGSSISQVCTDDEGRLPQLMRLACSTHLHTSLLLVLSTYDLGPSGCCCWRAVTTQVAS